MQPKAGGMKHTLKQFFMRGYLDNLMRQQQSVRAHSYHYGLEQKPTRSQQGEPMQLGRTQIIEGERQRCHQLPLALANTLKIIISSGGNFLYITLVTYTRTLLVKQKTHPLVLILSGPLHAKPTDMPLSDYLSRKL